MSNAKPRRIRRRKAGNTAALKRVMWQALVRIEEIVLDPNASKEELLRAASAIATLGGAYSNVTKAHEFEERLIALEKELSR